MYLTKDGTDISTFSCPSAVNVVLNHSSDSQHCGYTAKHYTAYDLRTHTESYCQNKRMEFLEIEMNESAGMNSNFSCLFLMLEDVGSV
jgi:hypothetical protein